MLDGRGARLGLAWVGALSVACGGAPSKGRAGASIVAPAVASAGASASPEADDPRAQDPLRARLAKEQLRGFVIVRTNALYFPTADAARTAKEGEREERRGRARKESGPEPEPGGGFGLQVVEDLGDVVKVSTDVAKTPLPGVDARFALELFVKRSSLLPVLRAPRLKAFDDGTAYALREGLVVSLAARTLRPAQAMLAKVPVEIAEADVGLSFALAAEAAAIEPLARPVELGCVRQTSLPLRGRDSVFLEPAIEDAPRTVLKERRELLEEQRAAEDAKRGERGEPPRGFGGFGGSWPDAWSFRCTFPDAYAEAAPADVALVVGGSAVGYARDAPGDRCSSSVRAWAVPGRDDLALVEVDIARATIRARTQTSALVEAGGCGAGSIGGLGRPKVKVVKSGAAAYFPEGGRAGTHRARQTKLRGASEVSGRTCVRLTYLTVPLCFDGADVSEVEDSGWD